MHDAHQSGSGSATIPDSSTQWAPVTDGEILIVSNRQPYRHTTGEDGDAITVDRPTGGLTAGLDPAMCRVGGTWIAWGDGERDRAVVDVDDCVSVPPEDPAYALRRVWLTDEEVTNYYYGFSNQVMWPVCHATLTNVRCDPQYWQAYRSVNEKFARSVVEEAGSGSVVWFHDYHLALAPRIARDHLPTDTTLMHFWHIPWPSWDTFRACPHGSTLLRGLLGNDRIGFHVPRYRTNFLECADAALPDARVDWDTDEVHFRGTRTAIEANPMGVPVEKIRRLARSSQADTFWSGFKRAHDIGDDTRIAVGVERLDYTKGLIDRLRALERLWESRPEWKGRLTYVQKASESRSKIPAYRQIQERVEAIAERVNKRFGTSDWQPIVYTSETLSEEELYGLYRQADVGLVTPIRDGMNLVAQEYVAAQVGGTGVLVLSDQVGAGDSLGEDALTVNPFDIREMEATIVEALTMPYGERARRMEYLRRRVSENDLGAWLETSLRPAATRRDARDRRLQYDAP